jgi:hypothetical protein
MFKIWFFVSLFFLFSLADKCPCSDDKTKTCCQLPDNTYGCCPYAEASCCSDREHCCPKGYKCDVPKQSCVKGDIWSTITKIELKVYDDCPKGTCATDQTCCQLSDGSFGCCPYKNADCCEDHAHCCPNGYKCDIAHQQCVKNVGGRKLNIVAVERVGDTCKAGTCDTKQTCCQLQRGWGCCQYINATCCSDKAHCCPNGYKCNLNDGACSNSTHRLPFQKFNDINLKQVYPSGDTCKAGTCDTTETCCELTNGSWGCCPYPKADCCEDHAHCCPNGYTCNIKEARCDKQNSGKKSIISFEKLKI